MGNFCDNGEAPNREGQRDCCTCGKAIVAGDDLPDTTAKTKSGELHAFGSSVLQFLGVIAIYLLMLIPTYMVAGIIVLVVGGIATVISSWGVPAVRSIGLGLCEVILYVVIPVLSGCFFVYGVGSSTEIGDGQAPWYRRYVHLISAGTIVVFAIIYLWVFTTFDGAHALFPVSFASVWIGGLTTIVVSILTAAQIHREKKDDAQIEQAPDSEFNTLTRSELTWDELRLMVRDKKPLAYFEKQRKKKTLATHCARQFLGVVGAVVLTAVIIAVTIASINIPVANQATAESSHNRQEVATTENISRSSDTSRKSRRSSNSGALATPKPTYADWRWPTTNSQLLAIPENDRWYTAYRRVNTYGTIAGPVARVYQATNSYGQVYIDIGSRYDNPNRAQIIIWPERIAEVEDMLNQVDHGSAWISFTGWISSYQGVPEIDLNDADWSYRFWTGVK